MVAPALVKASEGLLAKRIPDLDRDMLDYIRAYIADGDTDLDRSGFLDFLGPILRAMGLDAQTSDTLCGDLAALLANDDNAKSDANHYPHQHAPKLYADDEDDVEGITNESGKNANNAGPRTLSQIVDMKHELTSNTLELILGKKMDIRHANSSSGPKESTVNQAKLKAAEAKLAKKNANRTLYEAGNEHIPVWNPDEKPALIVNQAKLRNMAGKDVHIENFDVHYAGKPILLNADLGMSYGRRYGLVGSNGVGKCLGPEVLVLMGDGSERRADAIQVGDVLVGDDGQPRIVLSTIRGRAPMYRVRQAGVHASTTLENGYTCNNEHLIVMEPEKQDCTQPTLPSFTVTAETLFNDNAESTSKLVGDVVACKPSFHQGIRRAVTEFPQSFDLATLIETEFAAPDVLQPCHDSARLSAEDAAWYIGAWLGDGMEAEEYVVTQREVLFPEAIQRLHEIADHSGLKIYRTNQNEQPDCPMFHLSTGTGPVLPNPAPDEFPSNESPRNVLCRIISALGMHQNKYVPHALIASSVSVRRALLAGLIDAAGHLEHDGRGGRETTYEITQKRELLARGIVALARSLGLGASIHPEPKNGTMYHRVRFSLCASLPCVVPKKRAPREHGPTSDRNPLHYGLEMVYEAEEGDYCGFQLGMLREGQDAPSMLQALRDTDAKAALVATLGEQGRIIVSDPTGQPSVDGRFAGRFLLADYTVTHNTTLLRAIAEGELRLPRGLKILHVEQEARSDDTPALRSVLMADEDRENALALERQITQQMQKPGLDTEHLAVLSRDLEHVTQRLQNMDADTAEARAGTILSGLGFSAEQQQASTKTFSGGWRMRLALARALFCRPDLLLADEISNHLDLKSVAWLEKCFNEWPGTLLIVSHDRSFLDNVTTDILHLHTHKLETYKGNFSQFLATRAERRKNQLREYEAQLQYRQHLQAFIDRWRYNANRAAQAQSKIKILEKLPPLEPPPDDDMNSGMGEVDDNGKRIYFRFPESEGLPPPIIQMQDVTFGYTPERIILENITFDVHLQSKAAVVGPNGMGKTTLIHLMTGHENPTKGMVVKHGRLRIGLFSQHHVDMLDLSLSSVRWLTQQFPGHPEEFYRRILARFGLQGNSPLQPIGTLSGGQKSRVVFAQLAMQNPHLLVLDEPTNHLDHDSVNALADALRAFNGGVMIVSHDVKFLDMVCNEVWVCEHRKLQRFVGSEGCTDGIVQQYKASLDLEV